MKTPRRLGRLGCLFAALMLAIAIGGARADRVLLQQVKEATQGTPLWKGSPLFNAAEVAKAGFECGYAGEECTWVYSDQTGPGGTCEPPKIPPTPLNAAPTIAEFCGYHQTIPPYYWDGVYQNNTLLTSTIPNGPMYGCIIG